MIQKTVRVDEKKYKRFKAVVKNNVKTTVENAFNEMIDMYIEKHGMKK